MNYIPIVFAAVILSIIVDGWFTQDAAPSKTLLAAMLVLVLAPLASKIKVFDFLEFQKSVDRIDEDLTATKEEIATVANNLQVLQLGINTVSENRQAQNVTVNVLDEVSVEKLKQSIKSETEEGLKDSLGPPEFSLSPAYRFRSFLETRLKQLIGEIKTGLFVHYVVIDVTKYGGRAGMASSAIAIGLPELIRFFQARGSVYKSDNEKDEQDLEYLGRLKELNDYLNVITREIRSMMHSKDQLFNQSTPGPDMETIRAKTLEAELLKGYFLGEVVGTVGALTANATNQSMIVDWTRTKTREIGSSDEGQTQDYG